MKRFILRKIFLFLFSVNMIVPAAGFSQAQTVTLWKNGSGAHHNYRIPSLIVTRQGTLLAFCEGREGGDAGDIDLLLRRSEDNGQNWSEEQVVWDDGPNTCGNPCPVVDQSTGRIWLFLTWNRGEDVEKMIITKRSKDTRRPFLCYSDDDGRSWSKPVEMTASCKDPSWGWYATGPGIGIQLKSKKYAGRLVIPANHSYDDPGGNLANGPFRHGSHVLISDDHGKTWRRSAAIRPDCNESQLVELADGTLLMNMRSYANWRCRATSTSTDGGESWSKVSPDRQLVESRCQASIFHYGIFDGRDMFLFSNPAVPLGRSHMTIRTSFDQCRSWSNARLIHAAASAYSCLAKLPDGRIGLLFEYGSENRYNQIRFVSFPPEMLFEAGNMVFATP